MAVAEVEEVVAALPRKWVNKVLVGAFTVIGGLVVFGFSLGGGWVRGVDARAGTLEAKVQQHEVDIKGLAVATENLRAAMEKRDDARDERAKRMDRLLAILEEQAYNKTKEGNR